jgi:hypothetical protein
MSANPIDSNNTDKPTGSLEELFRHHLGEEAAVPPRPMLWDQIDNSLLLRQNGIYRRRLAVTRWVAAASITIASLAGTGWWATRDAIQQERNVLAAANQRSESAAAIRQSARSTAGTRQAGSQVAAATPKTAASNTTSQTIAAPDAAVAATTRSTTVHNQAPATGAARYGSSVAGVSPQANYAPMSRTNTTAGSLVQHVAAATATGTSQSTGRTAVTTPNSGFHTQSASDIAAGGMARPANGAPAITLAATAGVSKPANAFSPDGAAANNLPAAASSSIATLDTRTASNVGLTANSAIERVDLLASRAAALRLTGLTALPTSFATVTVPADGTPAVVPPARKWQFEASYAVGAFNPNMNFSRAGGAAEFDYNPALGANSPALTEAAAAEYRANLRAGTSQRIAVRATRRLTGHWALSTGAELSQNRATSSSSLAFVGEQVPDFGQSVGGPMRTTNFRYRTASVPVEVRYTNPVKRGLSLYGRMGAVVSALLSVRAEVEGIPEATRTYSITAEGPYRRVLANVRGGAGAQYRPASGNWSVSLGPVAEMGLLSLNAHPAQGLMGQSRAYNIGLEAGVEFGRAAK